MKHTSFFRSFNKSDWKAFIIFTLSNIIHFTVSLYSGGLIALSLSGDFSPDFSATLTAKCIVAVVVAIYAGLYIRKLQVWLLSLPFQFALGCLLFRLAYSQLNINWLTTVDWVGYQLIAQAIGIAIGYHIRKRKKA